MRAHLRNGRSSATPFANSSRRSWQPCCSTPRVEANRLHGFPDCYKIKLRSSGYRLVYQVIDQEVVVFVIAVDKRERDQVYRKAAERLTE